jgi:hypothetical protein
MNTKLSRSTDGLRNETRTGTRTRKFPSTNPECFANHCTEMFEMATIMFLLMLLLLLLLLWRNISAKGADHNDSAAWSMGLHRFDTENVGSNPA